MKEAADSASAAAGSWTGYSDQELAAIRQALPTPVSDDCFNNEIEHLLDAILRPAEWRVRDIARATSSIADELEQERSIIGRALAVLSARASADFDPHDGQSLVGNRAAIAEASLHAFLDALDRERRVNEEYGKALDAMPASTVSNNFRPFQDRLLKATAASWRRMGGSVSFKKEYRAFFDAVVVPVLSSPSIKARHNARLTDGMFRTHVSKENSV
jgi:hypothetical protein